MKEIPKVTPLQAVIPIPVQKSAFLISSSGITFERVINPIPVAAKVSEVILVLRNFRLSRSSKDTYSFIDDNSF